MKRIKSFASIPFLVSIPLLLQEGFRMPWWGWVLIFAVILAIVIFLIRSGDKTESESDLDAEIPLDGDFLSDEMPVEDLANPLRTGTLVSPPAQIEAVEPTSDDLTIIEGIGPKINDFLRRSGITTFKQLARMDMDDLDRMLSEANFGVANPETWAEQAELAEEGKWDELKDLQDSLKGGRRVD